MPAGTRSVSGEPQDVGEREQDLAARAAGVAGGAARGGARERLERLLVLPRRLVEGRAPGRDVARPARALDGTESRFRRAGEQEMASESTPVVVELRGMRVAQCRGDVGVEAGTLGHADAL